MPEKQIKMYFLWGCDEAGLVSQFYLKVRAFPMLVYAGALASSLLQLWSRTICWELTCSADPQAHPRPADSELGPWLPPFSSYGPGPYPGSLLAVLTLRPTRDLLIQSLRFNKNLCAWLRLRGASLRASLMAQQVKNPPALQETQEMKPQSLGREDCLEKEMETHSSILAWEIPWTEKSVGLQSVGLKRV